MNKYETFLKEGKLIGEGSFKKAYRLNDLVMCIPRFDDKWSKHQVKAQINYWLNSNEEVRDLLVPIVEYSYNPLYYIVPYCERTDKHNSMDYKQLDLLCDEDSEDSLYYEDVVVSSNQGLFNGKLVLIDYGLTETDFYQWKLDTEGVCLEYQDGYLYAGISDIPGMMKISYFIKDNSFHITNYLWLEPRCQSTTLREEVISILKKEYEVIDDSKKTDNLSELDLKETAKRISSFN